MTAASPYAWVITRSYIEDSVPDSVEYGTEAARRDVNVAGPHGATDEQIDLARHEGVPFKIFDDDGIRYYEGRFWASDGDGADSEYAFGPLDDYGTPNAGAVTIKYRTASGSYETL